MQNLTGNASTWIPKDEKEIKEVKETTEIKILSDKELKKLLLSVKSSSETLKKNLESLYRHSPDKGLYDAMVFIDSIERTFDNLN
jgi:hypothetical protein